ncbi:TraR/DksA C4-type zinc finger protein [Paenibacillus spongiae]|uniref:TraR/DksA C4-type zinc finger protein n=1 Tax=Paenibacillus spongiae TaxID=2909671 RepID=A0ABY5SFA0_9BACL|nr:TraR/DksA C4-type zinc finger protein [Paenibacillus spongiae]UVI32213.1 TraR/DksA C4-type zinc finger protein [Paenibacillus spongiae]
MTNLTEQELRKLRSRLEAEKSDIERRLTGSDHYGLGSSQREGSGELSAIDNHPGDMATETYERGKDIALLEHEDLRLSRIDSALDAMDNGEYGHCLTCGKAIPPERLEALPDTLYCLDHSPRQDISERRPVEEKFLAPPFGRSSLDEEEGYNGFDGEDAWQIVESWGNSDSPAMSENTDVDSYEAVGIEYDDPDGYTEAIESFLATDITGTTVSVIRNRAYYDYIQQSEGDNGLESDDDAADGYN